ncbi:hypothetical protein DOTSEDRAFT_75840 [Dothistroma septosporum NZE10]|uniref:C2H2-type domain-containing protein n=1 Tax=Dothistroma septosporum (strain NZE10 / CBS 128990) TaxID=675120 RepID=N1PBT6_DOTSN|nr:hypothetical protein DOTSEDRAFT_75840 [Dothistroma septosporum NZE10]
MDWQQAHQTHGYADNARSSAAFMSDQATGYGIQEAYHDTYLTVPVRQEYERSTTADSACSLTAKAPSLKRRSCDHERDASELTRTGSKRAKRPVAGTRAERTDGEYFCTYPGCDRKFDRLCETKKHFKAKHTPLQLKPHGCTIDGCDFRGMWPKDIRRHWKQKHGVLSPTDIMLSTSDIPPPPDASYEGTLATSPSQMTPIEEEKTRTPTMATLAQAFSMLKRLRIRSQSIDDSANKYIMVTKDGDNFRDVDVTGADTSESLVQRIKSTLDVPTSEMSNATVHRWYRRGAENHLTRQALLSLVSKSADSEGALRLFFKLPQAVLPPAHTDSYSAVR